ncbi:MAG: hypothetical protein FWC66_07335 [Oscillospiraceae bacterium]|nr:hypothetical protein [Oscillospiraceae bacterium]
MKNRVLRSLGALLLVVILALMPMTTVLAASVDVRQSPDELIAQAQAPITRGEFAMLIESIFAFEVPENAENFLDVPANHPYAAEILAVRAAGYMVGNSTGNFFPDRVISGPEAAAMLGNMLSFDGSLVPQVSLSIPTWAIASASVLIDLTMVEADLIERQSLTVGEALEFINAIAIARLIPEGTPYALVQTNPRDNFFSYINRQFLATGLFNPGEIIASSFGNTELEVRQQQQVILTEILANTNHAVGSDGWRIQELYTLFMDEYARVASISRLQPYFDAINAAESIDELLEVARRYATYFNLMPYYSLSFIRDARVDATQWAAIVSAAPLGLGSRDFYADDESLAGIHAAYIAYIAALLAYIGETENLEERALAVFQIEQARATRMRPMEYLVNPQTTFVETTWDIVMDATSTTRSLEFNEDFLRLAQGMNVYSPDLEYIRFIESLYVEENLEVLRDAALLEALLPFLPVLGDDAQALSAGLHEAIFGAVGGEGMTLEERAQQFVTSMMWRTFSRMYYQRFSSQEIKDDVSEMVEEIRDTMRERIANLTWMSEETIATAIEKLDAVQAFVAFPDEPIAEIAFEIQSHADGGCLVEMMLQLAELNQELSLETLSGPANVNLWESMPTSIVNAFYSGMDNAIFIPAGILNYPFYDPNATREQNLGAIGAVIAHEFTHAFDPGGSQFDKDGTLRNWWTEDDFLAFNALNTQMVETISAIEFVGINLNGAFSAGEAIADLGAMAAVLDVVAAMPDGDLSLAMESWARMWAARMSPEVATFIIFNSPHLPMKLRVNFILAQLDEFYEVFGIVEGDGMYIPAEQRLSIW